MSRPWNSSLHLHIGADRVVCTLRRGWPRRAAIGRAVRDIAASGAPGAGDFEGHTRAIEAVLDELAAAGGLKGARLDAVLSSALLHLDVVEGKFADNADRQLQEIACACVAEMLGDNAAAHEVRWHLQRDARHLFIVAMPRHHLATLQAVAQRSGLRLRSVTPEFVVCWNRFGRLATTGRWIFAVSTRDDLSVATVVAGALSRLHLGPGVDMREAAMRQAGLGALDARVDRLLHGSGQDPADQARFMLVASDAPAFAAPSRWTQATTGDAA